MSTGSASSTTANPPNSSVSSPHRASKSTELRRIDEATHQTPDMQQRQVSSYGINDDNSREIPSNVSLHPLYHSGMVGNFRGQTWYGTFYDRSPTPESTLVATDEDDAPTDTITNEDLWWSFVEGHVMTVIWGLLLLILVVGYQNALLSCITGIPRWNN
ncbi:hypothetical protein GGR50DRAFT_636369 [Xylaria sp. CBS 124048]|nr:hypothetical protein GGR50DRAFT_636369 [Xylaria sp. CBS 124048]